MKIAIISPRKLFGHINIPPSKSAMHRAIICAALAQGQSVISPTWNSEDIKATLGAVAALGATVKEQSGFITIDGRTMFSQKTATLDCFESGSTLRFMLPVAAAGEINATFIGHGKLPSRPLNEYLNTLPKAGIICDTQGGLPLTINGKLKPGRFSLSGNVSSQFITGFLLALPLLDGDSVIELTSPLESASYVDMTIEIMNDFGVTIESKENYYFIKGNQSYASRQFGVEGDWSQAGFWTVAGALGADITCHQLKLNSIQGDSAIVDILKRFGAKVNLDNGIAVYADKLCGIDIDASQIPDLVPILAVLATLSTGKTTIYNAARLRIKESDRLKAITDGLSRLGANIKELPDGLEIIGKERLIGGKVSGYNDHRIVMALAIAAQCSDGKVEIDDAQSISKSYPTFFDDLISLGGVCNVLDMG
jgi:3-phosphoshikimate 1-carboxyvinyltransferase